MTSRETLCIATDIAYALLKSGAEIYRVEESVNRIFEAYQLPQGSIFAIPTLLIVSATDENGTPHTEVRRLGDHGNDMDREAKLNDLCRRICAEKPEADEIHRSMAEIENSKGYTLLQQVIACGIVSFGFAFLFGGSWKDAVCAFICSLPLKLLVHEFEKLDANSFFTTICASFYVGIFCFAAAALGLGDSMDIISIGVLMNLVPGVALTNMMRDLIAGDLISSLSKLVVALLTATGIAIGTGTAITICRMLTGVVL